ncbi:MAG: GTPase [Candidatus Pacearchaeota archaeon]
MPVNASPEYVKAEKEYLEAKTLEEKIEKLKKMISLAPSHKGAENLRAELKSRLKRLVESLEKTKKSGRPTQEFIKKGELQVVIIGPPNTGKTTLFKNLTKREIAISPFPYSTSEPNLGTFDFEDVKIQIIDMPSFPNEDKGIVNNADTLLLVVDSLNQIPEAQPRFSKTNAKILLIFNKIDLLDEREKKKTEETIKSKFKKNFFSFFLLNQNSNLEDLKKKIFESFDVIRVYTKEPKKEPSKEPLILKEGSSLKDMVEKISKRLVDKVKYGKVWGPSSKFPGQIVGLEHILKDKDIIELKIE